MKLLLDTHALLWFISDDPFDRMLISQSLSDQMTLVTPDPEIKKYSVQTLW